MPKPKRRRTTPPKYARHSSGQARVRINGKVHYLGPYGSAESRAKYGKLVAAWMQEREITHHDHPDLRIRQLTVMYLDYAESYYLKDGNPTSEVQSIRDALKRLNKLHRDALAAEFSPKMLKAVQRSLIVAGLCRTTINATVARIRRMFRWAVSEELVPTTILVGLETVRDLRKGRSEAREPEPVKAVPTDDINAVLPHVSRRADSGIVGIRGRGLG